MNISHSPKQTWNNILFIMILGDRSGQSHVLLISVDHIDNFGAEKQGADTIMPDSHYFKAHAR
jgi:hypothetical protein